LRTDNGHQREGHEEMEVIMYSSSTVNNGLTSNQVIGNATVHIQHDRGILYVYAADGTPLLKITGLPRTLEELDAAQKGHELKIDIITQDASCAGSYFATTERMEPSDQRQRPTGRVRTSVLRLAGATLPPHFEDV
jgi:hypothetical protein